jgi:hypothetical protein
LQRVGEPNRSTCTEWSITRSTGISGLIFLGSPPNRFIADRMAARSTTAGTPVKSCNTTRAGLNGISSLAGDGHSTPPDFAHPARSLRSRHSCAAPLPAARGSKMANGQIKSDSYCFAGP